MKKISTYVLVLSIAILSMTACDRNTTVSKKSFDIKPNYKLQAEIGLQYEIIDGGIYAKGVDDFGQLGESHTIYKDWVEVVKADNIIHIDAHNGTVVYLTSDGNAYGFGNSEGGVLQTTANERGLWEDVDTPRLLFKDCKYVSIGSAFMIFLKNDNTLWFVGRSSNGQSTEIKGIIPQPIKIADNILFAEAFGYTSAWIDSDYNLYLCGDNSYGQLGNGIMGCGFPTMFKDIYPEPYCALNNCIFFSTEQGNEGVWSVYAETTDGEKYAWGDEYGPTPILIEDDGRQGRSAVLHIKKLLECAVLLRTLT